MTVGSAGIDITSAVYITVFPGHTAQVSCGFAVEIPEGYELQMRPRSGLAAKHGITLLNSPGTIDSDYRGEVSALLHNTGENAFKVSPGDRIAQLVLSKTYKVESVQVSELSNTARGSGGFGHTGKN